MERIVSIKEHNRARKNGQPAEMIHRGVLRGGWRLGGYFYFSGPISMGRIAVDVPCIGRMGGCKRLALTGGDFCYLCQDARSNA
jgi:hypothetical protein